MEYPIAENTQTSSLVCPFAKIASRMKGIDEITEHIVPQIGKNAGAKLQSEDLSGSDFMGNLVRRLSDRAKELINDFLFLSIQKTSFF